MRGLSCANTRWTGVDTFYAARQSGGVPTAAMADLQALAIRNVSLALKLSDQRQVQMPATSVLQSKVAPPYSSQFSKP